LERKEAHGHENSYKLVITSLDIKDAFRQVPPAEPTTVDLQGSPCVIKKIYQDNAKGQKHGIDISRFAAALLLAILTGRSDLCIAGVFGAGKTRFNSPQLRAQ